MRQFTFEEITEALSALRDQSARPGDDERLTFLAFCLEHLPRSRGQFLQDLWVAYELGGQTGGYFVDVGASDGVTSSNSWFLERELGWSGIVAEPARVWRAALAANRGCHIDNRCVWIETGRTLDFNQPAIGEYSTIDSFSDGDIHADRRRDGERYPVETVSLNDLLAGWDAPRRIDYLSLDTEGSELDILQHFDFAARDVRLISVEHNHTARRRPIFDLLTARGYRRRFETLSSVDDWYVRDEAT
jgi:FkbM family methyltransferase